MTGIRFVLALWVILHHLTGRNQMLEAWSKTLPPSLANLIHGGYLAVGTFFVLSGFVLARAYAKPDWNRGSLIRYGIGRFARVYPVYLFSLALVAPFIIGSTVAGKPGIITSYGLLLQGWAGNLPVGWNTPAWSLSCEIFFYLCFPLFAIPLGRLEWPALSGIALVTCFLPVYLRRMGVPEAWQPVLHFSDFAIGIVAARAMDLLHRRGNPLGGRGQWLYLPGLASCAALIAFPEILQGMFYLTSVLRPLNALVLLGLAMEGGIAAAALSSRTAVYLGKASYSMYILHIPILWWCGSLGRGGRWEGVPVAVAYMGCVIGVSALVFRYVEEPANQYLRARIR